MPWLAMKANLDRVEKRLFGNVQRRVRPFQSHQEPTDHQQIVAREEGFVNNKSFSLLSRWSSRNLDKQIMLT